jgi:hypothetical protein
VSEIAISEKPLTLALWVEIDSYNMGLLCQLGVLCLAFNVTIVVVCAWVCCIYRKQLSALFGLVSRCIASQGRPATPQEEEEEEGLPPPPPTAHTPPRSKVD